MLPAFAQYPFFQEFLFVILFAQTQLQLWAAVELECLWLLLVVVVSLLQMQKKPLSALLASFE